MDGYFYETKYWKLLLPTDQRYIGYLILKVKAERSSLPEITPEEQSDFFHLIARLESFYKEKLNATMFNYSCLMNNAYRNNQPPHVHFHFLPRYRGPIIVLGQEFSDPNFGMPYIMEALNGKGEVMIPDTIRAYIQKELQNYLQ